MLNWQQIYCPDVKYILKSDDDTVVHLERLRHYIHRYFEPLVSGNPKLIFGKVWQKVALRTSPNDKWLVEFSIYLEAA